MSQEQQFLSPDQQDKLFQHLKDIGALSQDVGQNVQEPDAIAQNGTGNVDLATLQSLFKHAQNPNAVPMQEGDKLHPMDAISQITQGMGPAKPSWLNSTSGPQLQRDSNGQIYGQAPNDSPIGKLFGLKSKVYATGQNYFDALNQAGLAKGLDSSLPVGPDGKPWVNKATLDNLLALHRDTAKKPSYNQDQLKVLLNPNATPEDYSKAFNGQTPQEVIADRLRTQGLNDLQTRHTEGQWDKFTQAVVPAMVRGNTGVGVEARKLFAGQHALALFDQAKNQPDGADPRQQAEAAINVASMLMTNGVVTQSEVEKLLPNTWRNKAASWQEFFMNDPKGLESQSFMDRLEGTVNRQIGVSTENIKRANSPLVFGYEHLKKADPERFNNEIMAAVNGSYTINDNGQVVLAQQNPNNPNDRTIPAPPAAPKATGAWKVIR